MAVGRSYMLKKPDGPSAPKLFLDTKLVPAAVNVLGAAEVALDRASARTGVRTRLILAGAASVSLFCVYRLLSGGTRPGRSGVVAEQKRRT